MAWYLRSTGDRETHRGESPYPVVSPPDGRAHLLAVDPAPGVLTTRCGNVLPPVAVQFSDRPRGSLGVFRVCGRRGWWPGCRLAAEGAAPDPLAPGGQSVPTFRTGVHHHSTLR